jgi:hypothetical protein
MNYVSHSGYEHRTAGLANKSQTVQAWKTKKAPEPPQAQADILATLEKAQKGELGGFNGEMRTAAMAYAPQLRSQGTVSPETFNFGDVVDIINPLHHVPIVGMVYRGITDDQIGPTAQIVGGALFGGPVGAVTGTVNAVTKIQTGKDMGDHMLRFAGLKTDIQSDITQAESKRAAAAYAKMSLDNMPPPERITSFKLNS